MLSWLVSVVVCCWLGGGGWRMGFIWLARSVAETEGGVVKTERGGRSVEMARRLS